MSSSSTWVVVDSANCLLALFQESRGPLSIMMDAPRGNLFVKEMYVLGVGVVGIYDLFGERRGGQVQRRTMSEDSFCNVIEHATPLHNHDAAGDLVCLVSSCEFLYGECAQSMYAHGTHGHVPSAAHVRGYVEAETLGGWPGTIGTRAYGT